MSRIYTSTGAVANVPEISPAMTRKAVVAANVGNLIEWYDFGLYGFLATIIASKFFPSDNPTAALLGTFAVYASAFVVRPVGGGIWGRLADVWGRRPILAATVLTMSVGTLVIGVLPGYDTIGIAAPIILTVARLIQGFGASGEWSTATAVVIEYGDPRRRGFRSGFLAAGAFAGIPLATGISALISGASSGAFFETYGWRIPFLIAIPLSVVALYIRWRLEESPEFRAVKDLQESLEGRATPVMEALRTQWRAMLVFACIVMAYTASAFVLQGFFPTFLINEVGLSNAQTYAASTLSVSVLAISCIPAGWLVDRVGRKPMLLIGYVYMFAMMVPIFLIASIGGFAAAVAAQLLIVAGLFFLLTPMTVTLGEIFPPDVRAAAGGVSYNTATAAFGGTAPLVATALISATGSRLSVPIYVMGLAVISFVVVAAKFRETLPGRAGARTTRTLGERTVA